MITTTKFRDRITRDLAGSNWTPREIAAYIIAQESHGALCRSNPAWKLRAYYQAWPRYRPTVTPLQVVTISGSESDASRT
jgi:hypothetical protein